MSDAISSQTALDPDRPWITDEEQLPARMNWLDTLFNPTGESPKLHFTRAWTMLFFMGLLTWVGVGAIISIMGIVGADTAGASVFHGYLIAVVLGLTSIMSYVIHTRRLNHAGKISLRALIVLLPVVLGAGLMLLGVADKAQAYDKLYQERAEFLEDPAAWREAQLEEKREKQAAEEQARLEEEAAIAEAEGTEGAEGGERQRGGQRGGGGDWNQGPSAENPLPSKEAFILRPNIGTFSMIIVGFNTLIMIWSLLWVARVPNFGKDKDEAQIADLEPAGPFG
ncbi:MAG: hypothetical protein AAFO74_04340 [Pseudomonadota bacterium]